MKTLNLLTIVLTVSTAVMMACQDPEVTEIPKANSKITVFSFICPSETVLKVYVSTNKVVRQEENYDTIITDGDTIIRRSFTEEDIYGYGPMRFVPLEGPVNVTLSDGASEILLKENIDIYSNDSTGEISGHLLNKTFGYRIFEANGQDFKIGEGKTYFLTVEAEGKKVYASCTVPTGEIAIVEVQTDIYIPPYLSGFETMTNTDISKLKTYVRFTDIIGQINYYSINAMVFDTSDLYFASSDKILFDKNFTSDKDHDGKTIEIIGGYKYFGQEKSVIVQLDLLDENYYKYLNSSYQIKYRSDPLSEPFNIYSNIKGGLGVFGAYKRSIPKVIAF